MFKSCYTNVRVIIIIIIIIDTHALYFCQSLPMLQRGLFEIADLLVTTCVHLMICHPPFDVCYGIWCILPGVANAALDFFL